MSCKYCGSDKLVEAVLTEGVHHSKISCDSCDRFLAWGKKPQTIEQEEKIAAQIASLQLKNLTDWERNFVESIATQAKLSPKQKQTLDAIASKK